MLENSGFEVLYDTYAEYDEAGLTAESYIINNYLVPVVVRQLALGVVAAEYSEEELETLVFDVTLVVTTLMTYAYYEGLLDSGELTQEEYMDIANEMDLLQLVMMNALAALVTEGNITVLVTTVQGLDDAIRASLETITETDEEVLDVVAFIEVMLEEEIFALICDLSDEDLTNLLFVFNLTIQNTLDFDAILSTVLLSVLEELMDENGNLNLEALTSEFVQSQLSVVSESFSDIYGSITKDEFVSLLTIINDFYLTFTNEELIDSDYITVYASMLYKTVQSVDCMLGELANEDNETLLFNVIELSIALLDETLEEDVYYDILMQLLYDGVILSSKVIVSGVNGENTLTTDDLELLLGDNEGMVEYLYELLSVVATIDSLDYEADDLGLTEEQMEAFGILIELLMG